MVPGDILALKHLRRVDLSFNELTTLPPALTQLQQLAHLVLTGNKYTDVPEAVRCMGHLQTLGMQKNRVRDVPPLGSMAALRELDLFMNAVEHVSAQLGTRALATLLLRANRLTHFEPGTKLPPSLTHLDLSSNPLQELPPCVLELPMLRTLEAVSCDLEWPATLPDSLETLNVANNERITLLPPLCLPRLQKLCARSCSLTAVSVEALEACPQLRTVDLDYNPLTQAAFGPTVSLLEKVSMCSTALSAAPSMPIGARIQELALVENTMELLPVELAMACGPTLKRLYVLQTHVREVSVHFLQPLVVLEELLLSKNRLTAFPAPADTMATLRRFEVAQNSIRVLPDELFVYMPGLMQLDVACNELAKLPSSLWECCAQLVTLNVFGNFLTVLPERMAALSHLAEFYAGNNRIAEIPAVVGANLPQLRTLHMAGNALQDLPHGFNLPRLERLYLGRNAFPAIPTHARLCTGLQTLDLSGNRIRAVHITGSFPSLTELILSHNTISSFDATPSFAASFPALTALDLSDNPIAYVPALGSSKTLEIVNMLHCGITQLTAKQQRELSNIRIIYMQGNPIETNRRTLRASYVENRTDLIISDLKKPHLFMRLATSQQQRTESNTMGVAWSEIKGGRSTQEDTISITQRRDGCEQLFGVFDGHRGSEVSQHCAIYFPHLLKHTLADQPQDSGRAMREAFGQLSESIHKQGLTSGATAAVALVLDDCITLGHLGDARAVLYEVISADQLPSPSCDLKQYTKTLLRTADGSTVVAVATRDHTARNRSERTRVERDLGGYVSEQGRVMGDIAVTRALGDAQFAPYITNEPSVLVVQRSGAEVFLVVACDGLWDVMTVEVAYALVAAHLKDYTADPSQVALMLRDWAVSMGSTDNISVLVVTGLSSAEAPVMVSGVRNSGVRVNNNGRVQAK